MPAKKSLERLIRFKAANRLYWEDMKLLLTFSNSEVREFVDRNNKKEFECQILCRSCFERRFINLTRTTLFQCLTFYRKLFKKQPITKPFYCNSCRAKLEEKELAKQKAYDELNKKTYDDKHVFNYIMKTYFDPERKVDIKMNGFEFTKLQDYCYDLVRFNTDYRDALFYNLKKLRYHEFLKTNYWLLIRWKVKEHAKNQCSLCSATTNLQAHHRSYAHHGEEIFAWHNELICLCQNCHRDFHFRNNLEKPQINDHLQLHE